MKDGPLCVTFQCRWRILCWIHGTLSHAAEQRGKVLAGKTSTTEIQSLLKALNHGTCTVQKHQWKLHNFLDVDCDVMLMLILGENKSEQFFQGMWLCSCILYLVVGKYVSKTHSFNSERSEVTVTSRKQKRVGVCWTKAIQRSIILLPALWKLYFTRS